MSTPFHRIILASLCSLICFPALAEQNQTPSLPEDTEALAQAGALAFSRGNWQQAVDHYTELLEIQPDNPLSQANLGQSLYRLGEFQRAIQHLEQALQLQPELTSLWITKGLCHQRIEQPYHALAAFSEAVSLQPDNPQTHHFLALAMHQMDWSYAAQSEMRVALQLDPDFSTAHYNLARIYLESIPPSVYLANRHYTYSLETGGERDPNFEAELQRLANQNDLTVELPE